MALYEPIKNRISAAALTLRKGSIQIKRYGLRPGGAKRHVFVAGVQRSGTNLVMDVLERSCETSVFHERDPRAFDNYQMRGYDTIRKLTAGSRAPVFVIKALCESQDISKLLDSFRPAKALWLFRCYDDVVNSMLVSFSNHAIQIRRLAEDRVSAGWRGQGMSDETHAIVQEMAGPDLNDATAAALMWYLRNVLYFEQKLHEDSRVLPVRYEELVVRPKAVIQRVFDFLCLEYASRTTEGVFASSIKKRPPPRIDPEVRSLCEELYERFPRHHSEVNR